MISAIGDDITVSVEHLLMIPPSIESKTGTGFVKLPASLY